MSTPRKPQDQIKRPGPPPFFQEPTARYCASLPVRLWKRIEQYGKTRTLALAYLAEHLPEPEADKTEEKDRE